MAEPLRPHRGGFLRPFGCGWFIREFLLGYGPDGSPSIDPEVGAPQADVFYFYKRALMRATAVDQATREEEKRARREKRSIDPTNIDKLAKQYLSRMPYKSRGCRFHSFVVYFSNLQRLNWVESSGREEPSSFQIIIHRVRHADISVSPTLAELLLIQPGLIPIALFTANVRPTGYEADNVWLLFMKSEVNQRRDSCSKDVQIVFRILFKCRLQRSNMVQIPTIYRCENHMQKETNDGTINSKEETRGCQALLVRPILR